MNEPEQNSVADLADRYLAGDPTVDLSVLSVEQRKQLADLLLLETLLHRTLAPAASQAKPPVETTLQRIREESTQRRVVPRNPEPVTVAAPPEESNWRVWHRRVARNWNYIAAFAVSLILGIYTFYQPLAPTAQAAVRLALVQAEQPADQLYAVTAKAAGPLRAGGLFKAQLYVRGPNQFAVQIPLPQGPAWIGSNGRQSWMVPALQLVPVHVSDDPAWLDAWLSAGDVSIAKVMLDMPSILRRLEARYTLDNLPLSPLPSAGADPSKLYLHVRGTDAAADRVWPERIEFWADPQTGTIERLEMAWPEKFRKVGPENLIFERQPSPALPANWFDHAGHHAPGRVVLGKVEPAPIPAN